MKYSTLIYGAAVLVLSSCASYSSGLIRIICFSSVLYKLSYSSTSNYVADKCVQWSKG